MSKRSADLFGPTSFGNVEFVGEFVERGGRVVLEKPKLPRPPRDHAYKVMLPAEVITRIERGEIVIRDVVGDSMQPQILDGDILVIDLTQQPKHGDVVSVVSPSLKGVPRRIARYLVGSKRAFLVKDNPRFRDYREDLNSSDFVIEGSVQAHLQRQRRRKAENWIAIQNTLSLVGADAPFAKDVGQLSEGRVRKLSAVLDIPATEFLDGRLPWGLFRARSKRSYAHLGIRAGEWLTVEPTSQSQTGDCVIASEPHTGEITVGVLQRDGADWYYGSLDGCAEVRIQKGEARTDAVIRTIGVPAIDVLRDGRSKTTSHQSHDGLKAAAQPRRSERASQKVLSSGGRDA